MNKKRIAQILTVLILLSNVNFQPNLIYADEVGDENVVSGSNLEEEETGKEIELGTYNITKKIEIDEYQGFNFDYEVLYYIRETINENNLALSNLKFDKDKGLYYYEAVKRTENDDYAYFDNLKDLEQRKKYKIYIELNNFIWNNDFGHYDTITYYLNKKFSRINNNDETFKTDNIKYKDGDYIYTILKDEYNKEYKLYTKQKELNEFIESDLIISKEELENQEISESIDSIKSELQGFNKSPYYFVNLEIKSNKIKSDNGKLYIEVIDKISNKTYKLHVNTYDEITIEVQFELRYKKYYEENGKVYLKTFSEEKRNEIKEKVKNILGERFFTKNMYDNPNFEYIKFYKNTKNGKPEYEASIMYETENYPKRFLKVKFVTDGNMYFTQNIGLQKDEEISKENEDLIINFYKKYMINVKDLIFLSKVPKKENNKYYYDVKIINSDGTETVTKLYIVPKIDHVYMLLFNYGEDEIRINFPSNRFKENNLLLTDEEINEIKNKFLKYQKNIYYNIKSVNVDRKVGNKDNIYWIDVKIETEENVNYYNDFRLQINNEEKKATFFLFKPNEEDISKYYISKDGTYIYFVEKNDEIGISLSEYIKNDLKENEKIEKINFSEYNDFIRYTLVDNLNKERLIDIPLSKEDMGGMATKIGVPKYSIEIENSVKETRDITEKDKEIISKIFKNKYKGLVKDIKFSDKIFGQNQSNGNAYTFIEINPKDNNPFPTSEFDIYRDNDHNYYKVLLTSPDVDVLCESQCPPTMYANTEEPLITCNCTSKKPKPIKPEDFPDPEEPNHNEPLPKVTPSDLPKPTPSNIPKTSTPPTVTNRTPITIIKPKPNEETNQIKNEEPINNKPEVKSESRISRDIKTSDNLFILLSLFSGMLSLFSFISIYLNKRKSI